MTYLLKGEKIESEKMRARQKERGNEKRQKEREGEGKKEGGERVRG